jgi:hypothetical protein
VHTLQGKTFKPTKRIFNIVLQISFDDDHLYHEVIPYLQQMDARKFKELLKPNSSARPDTFVCLPSPTHRYEHLIALFSTNLKLFAFFFSGTEDNDDESNPNHIMQQLKEWKKTEVKTLDGDLHEITWKLVRKVCVSSDVFIF